MINTHDSEVFVKKYSENKTKKQRWKKKISRQT